MEYLFFIKCVFCVKFLFLVLNILFIRLFFSKCEIYILVVNRERYLVVMVKIYNVVFVGSGRNNSY